jgi:hypothetical protein
MAVLVPSASAVSFLQSVVMFDDKAYAPMQMQVGAAANLDELFDGSDYETNDDEEFEADPDPEDFDTQVVVRGFADRGMTCAVLAPSGGDPAGDTERFLSLSRRADVVILDWLIDQNDLSSIEPRPASQNRTSLQLMMEVLRRDFAVGSRLRLICIYSGAHDLSDVQANVVEAFKLEFPQQPVAAEPGCLDIADARIVFLAKADDRRSVATALTPEALPARVVEEFAKFAAKGILPELALQSLSAVRDQAHRLLRRFRAELDPALLSHRAMTTPADTEEFVVDLIGDELTAIVSNGHVTRLLDDYSVEGHVKRMLAGVGTTFYWKGGRSPGTVATSIDASKATRILLEGVNSSHQYIEGGIVAEKFSPETSLSSLAMGGAETEVRSRSKDVDLEFAMLSSLSRDGSIDGGTTSPPELRLGSILCLRASSSGAGDRFFLCLQPLCDSVRLQGVASFPLLPLPEMDIDGNKFGLVVREGALRVLSHELRLGLLESSKFRPNKQTQTVLAKWERDEWVFVTGARRYVWLGNLRTDKAHRLANSLGANAGRVGINEYEYFRRRHE